MSDKEHRYHDLNPIKEPERAKKLLMTSPHFLTGLERQRQYILGLHIVQKPCPACGEKCNIYEATGGTTTLGEYDENQKYFCPSCKTELLHIVPFIAMDPWHWQCKEPPLKGKK